MVNMKCSKAQLYMSMLIDNELSQNEKEELDMHISVCKECADEYKSFLSIHQAMKAMEDAAPPEQMAIRFSKAIKEFENNSLATKRYNAGFRRFGKLAAGIAAAIAVIGLFADSNFFNIQKPVNTTIEMANVPMTGNTSQANDETQYIKLTNPTPVITYDENISLDNKKIALNRTNKSSYTNRNKKSNTVRTAYKNKYKKSKQSVVAANKISEAKAVNTIKEAHDAVVNNMKSARMVEINTAMRVSNQLNEANITMNESLETVRGTLRIAADLIASDRAALNSAANINGEMM